jgi:Raf kinase inhibitor-like YbhB/YbcL family protein
MTLDATCVAAAVLVACAVPGDRATDLGAAPTAEEDAMSSQVQFTIRSPAFEHGRPIPVRFTDDGEDVNPELQLAGVPAAAKSLALIMDDPDAPMGTWVHWVVWGISPEDTVIPEDGLPAGAAEGLNSWGRSGYGGPAPPSGTHRYFFKAYALDTTLELPSTATKKELEAAMEGHVIARAQIMGTYSR